MDGAIWRYRLAAPPVRPVRPVDSSQITPQRQVRNVDRILVAEDEPAIADSLVRGLREEGYLVELAVDGITAQRELLRTEWDLVVLDWWLPGMTGYDVLCRFREAGRSTPALFLTARDGVAERVRPLNAGADDYLCKPFDFDEFLARVRALLRRKGPLDATTLHYADLGLTVASHIMAALSGSIRVESEVGKGSRFTVRLPLVGAGDNGHLTELSGLHHRPAT